MTEWAEFNENGDLPVGIHQASLADVINHFGTTTVQRQIVALRLARIYQLAKSTRHLARFIIFGSFITAKPNPNDVDIILIMDDDFDSSQVTGEAALIFDHLVVQNYEGASVFWIRKLAAIGGEQAAIEDWQIKRDSTRRGIVEVVE